ncbi:MAG: cytochrome c [Candidatus Caldarchaeum sp.]
MRILLVFLAGAVLLWSMTGCHRDLWGQPRVKTYSASPVFPDGRSAREPVAGTVPRGYLKEDEHLYEGTANGQYAAEFPFEITLEMMKRGQDRYNIFCAPCHGRTGDGTGMIVQRGFQRPRSLHAEDFQKAPVGYLYSRVTKGSPLVGDPSLVGGVVTVGEGDMVHPALARQIPVKDRWAIVAYIRALQYSQRVPVTELSPEERAKLKQQGQGGMSGGH